MGPPGVDAPPAEPDSPRQGPRQTPQTQALPQMRARKKLYHTVISIEL